MNTNGILEQHWWRVFVHFVLDAALFAGGLLLGLPLRFRGEWQSAFFEYWPAILVGALTFASSAYISGLYSPRDIHQRMGTNVLALMVCYMGAVLAMVTLSYAIFFLQIGRGVVLIGAPFALISIFIHHHVLRRKSGRLSQRIAFVLASAQDERELALMNAFGSHQLEIVGVICDAGYKPALSVNVLGPVSRIAEVVTEYDLHRVVCTSRVIHDPAYCRSFCHLRYSGITVMPLISLCEELFHCVPLELVTPEWLMNASANPHIYYLKKLKRSFDIVSALLGLLLCMPLLAIGAAAVRLTSIGPVLYRQRRVGKFGRHFHVLKLRTMTVDAEKDGPVWARTGDTRVTPVGGFLRKYRIDELPQLVNVIRGEMSLVGPRPERPEFVEVLTKDVPYFAERLMVQPGLTGWAQVNYPYGASREDAIRKLEYDLYYSKHMSLFLDVFCLLDTVRIVLCGGRGTPGLHEVHAARRKVSAALLAPVATSTAADAPACESLPQPAI